MSKFVEEEVIAEARRTERVRTARLQQSDGASVETTMVERYEQERLEARSTRVDGDGPWQADPAEAHGRSGMGSRLSLSYPRAMIDRVSLALGRSPDEQ